MISIIRRLGIAIGSYAAAWLVMALFGMVGTSLASVGFPLAGLVYGSALTGLVTFLIGGLIYQDIMRRERPVIDPLKPGG